MTTHELSRVTRRILDGWDELHRRRHRLTSPHDAELGCTAKSLGCKPVLKSFRVLHRLAIDAHHHVAGFQPGLGSGALGVQVLNQRAAGAVEAERLGKILSDWLQRRPEPWSLHRAALQRRLNHEPHHVGRNRKSYALRSAAARKDGGVDAHETAVYVDERTAGIAGIDCCVGLDEELVVGDAYLRAGEDR